MKDTKDKSTQTSEKEVEVKAERTEESGGWLMRVYGGEKPKEKPNHAEQLEEKMMQKNHSNETQK